MSRIAIWIGIETVIGLLGLWICKINPAIEYTWYSGIWHGIFAIPKWVLHFFAPEGKVICKAIVYTSAYNFWWWAILIISIFRQIVTIIGCNNSKD